MLFYEGSGKILILHDYEDKEKKITKTQWKKKICNHTLKNIA